MYFILLFSNVVYSASLSRLNSTYATKSSCNRHPPTPSINMRWHISYMAHTTKYTNVTFFFSIFPPWKISSLCLQLLLLVRKKYAVFPTGLTNEQWIAIGYLLNYMEFSKQEYWSGLPFPSPGGLPDPGMELGSLALQVKSLPIEPPGKP